MPDPNASPRRAIAWRATIAAGVTVALLAAAAIAGASSSQGIALIWPVNAVATAILIVASRARLSRGPIALAMAAAVLGVNLMTGPPWLAPGFTLVNAIEVGLLFHVIRRFGLDRREGGAIFGLVMAAAVAAAIGASLAGIMVILAGTASPGMAALYWFGADFLGLVVLLPGLLLIEADEVAALLRPAGLRGAALVVALTGVVAAFAFRHGGDPLLFTAIPCGVFAAFRLRMAGALLSTLATAVVATASTIAGAGPIAAHFTSFADRALFLQAYLAVFALTAFPVAVLLDQRRQATRAARDSARELMLLNDNSTDMIVRIGLDGVRRYVSSACVRVLGYRPEEMVGATPIAAIHPDDRARVEQVCRSLLEGAIDPICTYRQQHRDGHYVWLEAVYRLVREGETPVEFIASVRDVSRRRAAEQTAVRAAAQIEERERLLALAEATARIGHWRYNIVDQTLTWSAEVYRIHGQPPAYRPSVQDAIAAYHVDDMDRVRDHVDRALGQGVPFSFQARIVRTDNQVRWVASNGEPEHAPNGQVVGLFGVFQDVTDHVEALRAAEQALEAKAAFTATMTHEIRTPLTSILGAAELLGESVDPVEQARHLEVIEHAGRILADIVDDVLLVSRLEGAGVEIEQGVFDVDTMVARVIAMFASDAARRGLSLVVDPPHAGRHVCGDRVRLARVLTNLVANAVKFTHHGGIRVSATVQPGSDRWCFEVEDSGIGIRDDRREAIFAPFSQADASITRGYGGTGLGLSICRMLVAAMGGTIELDSAIGRGSRFRVLVALAPAEPPAKLPAAGAPAPAAIRRELLLAEDNDTNRYLIGQLVERLGHRVTTVANGAQAVDTLCGAGARRFDHVLMDVQMPVMDGLAAARTVRASGGVNADVPIHALTADTSPDRVTAIRAAGMTGALAKPVALHLLAAVLGGDAHGAPPAQAAMFDPTQLQTFDTTIGRQARDTLLSMLIGEMQVIPARMRKLAAGSQRHLVELEAHSVRGAALSVGAGALVDIATRIETVARQGGAMSPMLDELDAVASAVIVAAEHAIAQPPGG